MPGMTVAPYGDSTASLKSHGARSVWEIMASKNASSKLFSDCSPNKVVSHSILLVDFPFIISTNRQKAGPETRKFIRSQVMRGKNRIKTRRKLRGGPLIANGPIWPTNIPRLLCSNLSAICFADTVEPTLIADILSCEWPFHLSLGV